MAPIEELEKRVAELERQIAVLRRVVLSLPSEETGAVGDVRMRGVTERSQLEFEEGWDRAMKKMGIIGEPIGVERLREMIAACGFKPEDNAFSRGIIEMREE